MIFLIRITSYAYQAHSITERCRRIRLCASALSDAFEALRVCTTTVYARWYGLKRSNPKTTNVFAVYVEWILFSRLKFQSAIGIVLLCKYRHFENLCILYDTALFLICNSTEQNVAKLLRRMLCRRRTGKFIGDLCPALLRYKYEYICTHPNSPRHRPARVRATGNHTNRSTENA